MQNRKDLSPELIKLFESVKDSKPLSKEKILQIKVLINDISNKKSKDQENNLNAQDEFGNTVLIWAAYKGHLELVNDLLKAGVDSYKKNKEGFNYIDNLSLAIIPIVKEKQYEKIQYFLEFKGTTLTKLNNDGVSADSILFESLIEYAKSGDVESIVKLKSCIPDEHLKKLINKKDDYNNTLLTWAAYRGHLNILNMLMTTGIDTTIKNKGNYDYLDNLSLHIISLAQEKQYKKMKTILEEYKGVKLTVKNDKGISIESVLFDTMIEYVKSGDFDSIIKLKSCLSDENFKNLINKKDDYNNTLLTWAAYKGHLNIINMLMTTNIDTTIKNKGNYDYLDNLSLHLILLAQEKQYKKMQTILEEYKGVKLTVKNDKGISVESVLFDAMIEYVKSGDLKSMTELKSCIPDEHFKKIINKKDDYNNTLLTWAAYKGHLDIVNMLMTTGIDPTIKNKGNYDYLDNLSLHIISLAQEKQYKKMQTILEEYKGVKLTVKNDKGISVESVLFDAMIEYVKSGDLKSMTELKSCIPDEHFKKIINKKDDYDNTLLTWAAYKGHLNIINMLMTTDIDTTIKNKDNYDYLDNLSLHIISLAQEKQYKKMQTILEEYKGITLTIKNGEGISAESILFESIIEYAKSGDIEGFKKFKSYFPNEYFKQLIDMQDQSGNTALIWAAYKGHLAVMDELLIAGAVTNLKNNDRLDYIDNLSLAIIPLAKEKQFKKIQSILEYQEIKLNIQHSDGTPEEALLNSMIDLIKENDLKILKELQSSLPKRIFDILINKEDRNYLTGLSWAVYKNYKEIIEWLKKWGADDKYDYLSKRNQFYSLTTDAFLASSEIKPSTARSIYKEDEKIITNYSTNTSEKSIFQAQFNLLLDLFYEWGKEYKCQTQQITDAIEKIKKEFFLPEYSGMQSHLYFETIKRNLEKILSGLQNSSFSLETRKKEYINLCVNFSVCCPGLFTHIEDVFNRINVEISLEHWLAEMRTNIIRWVSDKHNTEEKISEGNSIHTFNTLASYADKQGWSPLYSAKKVKDPHELVAKITGDDLFKFHAYFVKEYNPSTIRQCIQVNLDELLIKLCNEFNYKLNGWNAAAGDYIKFLEKLKLVLEKLGVQLSIDEYSELNEESTEFHIYTANIVDRVCENLFLPNIYYSPSKKVYINLIPPNWIERETVEEKEFDFKAWEEISSTQFPKILFKIIHLIPNEDVSVLLNNLSVIQLLEMVTKSDVYHQFLETIEFKERREFIKELIDNKTDLLKKNKEGYTLTQIVVRYGHIKLLQTLIKSKENLYIRDKFDQTLAHIAAELGHANVIEALAGTDLIHSMLV